MKATRIAIFAIMLLVGCRPASYEQFIRADQAQDGEYVFALDLSDSTATYDLSLYTRVDPALMAAATPSAELALQVCWLAPQPSVGEAVPDMKTFLVSPDGKMVCSAGINGSGTVIYELKEVIY